MNTVLKWDGGGLGDNIQLGTGVIGNGDTPFTTFYGAPIYTDTDRFWYDGSALLFNNFANAERTFNPVDQLGFRAYFYVTQYATTGRHVLLGGGGQWAISLASTANPGQVIVEDGVRDTNIEGGRTELGVVQTGVWYRLSGTVSQTQLKVSVYLAESLNPIASLTVNSTFGQPYFYSAFLGNDQITDAGEFSIAHAIITDQLVEPGPYATSYNSVSLSWWDGHHEIPLQVAGTGGGGGAVQSVNAQTGNVVLTASDLGALTEADGDARYVRSGGTKPTIAGLLEDNPFFIAHRGSGDEFPEHTLEAYRSALASGAKAIEISAHPTADGTYVCIHDTTLDRTTNFTGAVNTTPLAAFRAGMTANMSTYLGSGWEDSHIRPPTLREVLDELVGKAVLFVEMKSGTTPQAYAFLDLLDSYNAKDSIIWKSWAWSGATPLAKSRGYTTWCYIDGDTSSGMRADTMENADMIAVPHTFSDSQITQAVEDANGKPVTVWEIHRRMDVSRFTALGVQGLMSSGWRYVTRSVPTNTADQFKFKVRSPGDMGLNNSPAWMPTYAAEDSLEFGHSSNFQSMLMGSMCPITSGTYTLQADLKWPTLPTNTLHSCIAFCKETDAPWGFGSTTNTPGYHVILRANGELGLYTHTPGSGSGTLLGNTSTGTQTADTWYRIKIAVTPTQITVTKHNASTDAQIGTAISVTDSTHRGGYFHLGKGTADQPVRFKNVKVTT